LPSAGWWADGTTRDGRPIGREEWAMVRALRGEIVGGDLVEIEADGIRRQLLLRATPVRDAEGLVAGAVVAQLDISEQRCAEAALRESEQRFRTITNAMPQMVWTALPDGRIDYHNDQFYQFTGLAPGSAEGADWAERTLRPEDREAGKAAWARSVREGRSYEMTYRLRHRSGEYRWILARGSSARRSTSRAWSPARPNRCIRWWSPGSTRWCWSRARHPSQCRATARA
jgi:PAS domain S-box-containing protein